ncbi:MAG: hypothetical protein RJB13_284 [Pseudomonadota bacterium]
MTSSGNQLSQHSPFSRWFSYDLGQTQIPSAKLGALKDIVYLDSAAATPVDSRVLSSMLPWMTHIYGNPANRMHPMGEDAEHGLANARSEIADCLGVEFNEVYFCSSATEANNLVLRGLAQHPLRKRNKLVISATEHSSIHTTATSLAPFGVEVEILPVDENGQIILETAEKVIDQDTLAVCVMDVNNETGVVQTQLDEVSHIAKKNGAALHVDAVQGFARSHFSSATTPFDTATVSAAKIYAGRGAAALIVRNRHPKIRLAPQMTGGGHEFGLRSGTPNIAAIAGFAHGVRLQVTEREERLHYLSHLESVFVSSLCGQIDALLSAKRAKRVPGILMFRIPGVNAMKLIENCKNLCISSGSACKTLQATTSHVLKAMGAEEEEALAGFRVSIGIQNTEAEMKKAADNIATSALKLRNESAVWDLAKN